MDNMQKTSKNITIETEKILLVEGYDEELFLKKFLKHISIEDVQIINVEGKDKFKPIFTSLVGIENFTNIKNFGFIRDAEENPAKSAFDSLCDVIKEENILIPKKCGKIETNEKMKVGIFIMPDNQNSGMLEDLCLNSINEELKNCIDDFQNCIKDKYIIPTKDSQSKRFNPSKSKMLNYLSSCIPIDSRLGIASQKHFFDFDNESFNELKSFLKNLFT